jgi:hypothetical protein
MNLENRPQSHKEKKPNKANVYLIGWDLETLGSRPIISQQKSSPLVVRDDRKPLDDGGEIPKSQGKG